MGVIKPLRLDDSVELWERQPGESPTRYGQFLTYRDQGRKRTLAATAERLGVHYRNVRNAARAFLWVDRAAAWDAFVDERFRAGWIEEQVKAAERDMQLLRVMTGKAAEGLRLLNPAALSAAELLRLCDVLLRHSRLLFGDASAASAAGSGAGAGDAGASQQAHPVLATLHELGEMSPDARKRRLQEMTQQAEARQAALSGADDD